MALAAVTPAGVRDGDPAALAGLCARRGPAVLAYCERVAGTEHATAAASEAFRRFRAAVVAAPDPGDLDPEALLIGATREAAAAQVPRPPDTPDVLRFFARRPATGWCGDVPALLAARANRTILRIDLARLEQHLAGCPACRAPEARFKAAERAYRNPPDAPLPLPTTAAIMAALATVAPVGAGEPTGEAAAAALPSIYNGAGPEASLMPAPELTQEPGPIEDSESISAAETPAHPAESVEAPVAPPEVAPAAAAPAAPPPAATPYAAPPEVASPELPPAPVAPSSPPPAAPTPEPPTEVHAEEPVPAEPFLGAVAQPPVPPAPPAMEEPGPEPPSMPADHQSQDLTAATAEYSIPEFVQSGHEMAGARPARRRLTLPSLPSISLPRPRRPARPQREPAAPRPRTERAARSSAAAAPKRQATFNVAKALPIVLVVAAIVVALAVAGAFGGGGTATPSAKGRTAPVPVGATKPPDPIVVPGGEPSAAAVEAAKARARAKARRAAKSQSQTPGAPSAAQPPTSNPSAQGQGASGSQGASPPKANGGGGTQAPDQGTSQDTPHTPAPTAP